MKIKLFCLFQFTAFLLSAQAIPGSSRIFDYLPLIQGKQVAIVCNHSSMVGESHLVDTLLYYNVKIKKIFAPEHGFRGEADAGAKVKSGIDERTKLPIMSLYGEFKKPSIKDFDGIEVVIFDIQDVGARFYTYISTLQYIMEACADFNRKLIILDRPNPNRHTIDGPVLDPKFKSFVGMQPVPVIYGMTIGEYAKMLVGENWLNTKAKLNYKIMTCEKYNDSAIVELNIPPSPNLKTAKAICLYPSLCIFEGTNISVGRGTDLPFEIFGSPQLDRNFFEFTFIPSPKPGAKSPPFMNKACNGINLTKIYCPDKLDLSYILYAYQHWTGSKDSFFLKNLFFDKLAGSSLLRQQIIAGKTEPEIRKTWEPALANFKKTRKKYLLY